MLLAQEQTAWMEHATQGNKLSFVKRFQIIYLIKSKLISVLSVKIRQEQMVEVVPMGLEFVVHVTTFLWLIGCFKKATNICNNWFLKLQL